MSTEVLVVALSFFSDYKTWWESRCRGEERDGSLQRSSASPSDFLLRKMARDPRVCFAYSTHPSCLQLSGKSYDNS